MSRSGGNDDENLSCRVIKKVVRRGKNMMRIEPPGFFDPDFQLLNYTCENGCCEIVLHIKGRRKGENFFWTG